LYPPADWHDVNAIHYYYATRILKTLEKMGKTPIFYQETFEAAQRIHKSLPKNTIVGVWYNGEMAGIVARAGLRHEFSILPIKIRKRESYLEALLFS
jgi:N-acetyl-beta-hexosaminidase